MVTQAPTAAPSRVQQRERALAKYLGQVHAICHGQSGWVQPDAPLSIECGGDELRFDPWMQTEIHAAAASDGPQAARSTLVAHGAALQLKMNGDRAEFERTLAASSRTESYSAQAELMLDSALGMALLREIQQAIDEEIGCGRMEPAGQWSDFKNRLHGSVIAVKKLLAESEWRRAEALSHALTDQPQEDPKEQRQRIHRQVKKQIRETKQTARIKNERIRRLAKFPSRTEVLVALLVVTAAVWLGVVGVPRFLAEPPRMVRLADLPATEGILEVEARPPSLYVTVHEPTWTALDTHSRNQAVRSVSAVLLEKDYNGAWFKTEQGRPVAQWLRASGARLIQTRERLEEASPDSRGLSLNLSTARSRRGGS